MSEAHDAVQRWLDGDAEHAAGCVDRRDTIYCPYETPEDVLSLSPWERLRVQNHQKLVQRFEGLGVSEEEPVLIDDHSQVFPETENNPRVATRDEILEILVNSYQRD